MDDTIRINLLRGRNGSPPVDPPIISEDDSAADPGRLRDQSRPILVANETGRVVDANDMALTLLDYARERLASLYLADIIGLMDEAMLNLITKLAWSRRGLVFDALCYRRDGEPFPVEVVVRSVQRNKSGGWRIELALRNLAGQRTSREGGSNGLTARAERLDAIGSVAAKIAHDINNLLTPLLAYPELIRREVPAHQTVGEYLTIIQKTTEDMTRLTRQLFALARRGQAGNDIIDVNVMARQVLEMLAPGMPQGIHTELELAGNLLSVRGSKDQLRQMMGNLIQNALDAMGDTGTLKIHTENVYLDTPVAQYTAVNVGEYVKISVRDSGCGIPEALKEKVFDPFFTTKRNARQRGMGLGLSIVHAITRDHSGYVGFESAEGIGTTFYVYLPIVRQPLSSESGDNLPHGTERILVVDDDALQVQVLVSLLEVLGYKTTGASSGEECLRRIRENGERYDLVILDMVMEAGLGGLETFVALRQVVPTQRVMLISGFTKAARSIVKAQEHGAGAYLRKPLTIERVARTVREQLDIGRDAQTKPSRKGCRILIVDDEPMIRKLLGMIILSEFGDALIDHASNGREAVEAYGEGHHDVIVMDLQMPVMDGREAYVEIAQLSAAQKRTTPPVIFCTGFAPPSSMTAIIGDGAVNCLLRKPIKADTLLQAVRERLRG